jgi:hypothetical protein
MAPFSQGLVTWGTTVLIIGWVTGFFGLFGLQSDTWMKLHLCIFMSPVQSTDLRGLWMK